MVRFSLQIMPPMALHPIPQLRQSREPGAWLTDSNFLAEGFVLHVQMGCKHGKELLHAVI